MPPMFPEVGYDVGEPIVAGTFVAIGADSGKLVLFKADHALDTPIGVAVRNLSEGEFVSYESILDNTGPIVSRMLFDGSD